MSSGAIVVGLFFMGRRRFNDLDSFSAGLDVLIRLRLGLVGLGGAWRTCAEDYLCGHRFVVKRWRYSWQVICLLGCLARTTFVSQSAARNVGATGGYSATYHSDWTRPICFSISMMNYPQDVDDVGSICQVLIPNPIGCIHLAANNNDSQ